MSARRGRPTRVRAHSLGLGAWVGLSLAACGAGAPRPQPAEVRFLVQPAEARVYQGDDFLGSARVLARRPARFPPRSRQQFSIIAPGYFPHDVEMLLPPGLTTVRLKLRPVPR